jgi:hypothetical protein
MAIVRARVRTRHSSRAHNGENARPKDGRVNGVLECDKDRSAYRSAIRDEHDHQRRDVRRPRGGVYAQNQAVPPVMDTV